MGFLLSFGLARYILEKDSTDWSVESFCWKDNRSCQTRLGKDLN